MFSPSVRGGGGVDDSLPQDIVSGRVEVARCLQVAADPLVNHGSRFEMATLGMKPLLLGRSFYLLLIVYQPYFQHSLFSSHLGF